MFSICPALLAHENRIPRFLLQSSVGCCWPADGPWAHRGLPARSSGFIYRVSVPASCLALAKGHHPRLAVSSPRNTCVRACTRVPVSKYNSPFPVVHGSRRDSCKGFSQGVQSIWSKSTLGALYTRCGGRSWESWKGYIGEGDAAAGCLGSWEARPGERERPWERDMVPQTTPCSCI